MEPQDQQTPQQTNQQPSKGYGKRPMWQWVLIYLIIAIIVYGLIYLIFFHKSGSTGGSGY
jgi:flagellar basal body-associated protein FliL